MTERPTADSPAPGDGAAPVMNAARLRMVRQWLGVDVEALAELLEINVRNLRKYELGTSLMHPAVAQRLQALVARADAEVDALLEALAGQDQPGVLLYRENSQMWASRPDLRPLPVGWQRAVVARVVDELPGVVVDYPPR